MLITSSDIKIKTISEDKSTGVFEFDPLPKGFGYTLGNTLRRILLTSLEGAAITQIKVDGVNHQFSTLDGVKEDIVEIILNLKKVRFAKHSDVPEVLSLKASGEGKVTAKDIEETSDVDVINKDLVIATLSNKKANLKMELVVESGVGYSPMEDRQTSKVGVIVIDAMFSPVVNAQIKVEETRFGGRVDLDKLVLTVDTDGSIKPSTAVYKSAAILADFFGTLAKWELPSDKQESDDEKIAALSEPQFEDVTVEELPLQTRTINALKKHGIKTLSELARKTDEDLADIKNLGDKSVSEIKKLLENEGLNS